MDTRPSADTESFVSSSLALDLSQAPVPNPMIVVPTMAESLHDPLQRQVQFVHELDGGAASPLPSPSPNVSPSQTDPFGALANPFGAPGSTCLEPVNFSPPHHSWENVRKASSGSLASHPSYATGLSSQDSSTQLSLMGDSIHVPSHASLENGLTFTHDPLTLNNNNNNNSNKRLKRLQRNRESARLSRKRRKAYLEELELNVSNLATEMDRGRLQHAARAIPTIKARWEGWLRELEQWITLHWNGVRENSALQSPPPHTVVFGKNSVGMGIKHGLATYTSSSPVYNHRAVSPSTPFLVSTKYEEQENQQWQSQQQQNRPQPQALSLQSMPNMARYSRLSEELQILYAFYKKYLLSLVYPPEYNFVLWLTLKNECFWRGGRGGSERLSAARIGERLLHSGIEKASPSDGMWPLLCHEIGLSYEQEDRIRTTQRAILADSNTWITRHTVAATRNVIETVHKVISGAHELTKERERAIFQVLTLDQKIKFLAWAYRRSELIRRTAEKKLNSWNKGEKYEVSPQRHVSANMYIIDHQLSNITPCPTSMTLKMIDSTRLKCFSRRPAFESLAGQEAWENSSKLSQATTFPSTGSLKRSLNEVIGDDECSTPSMNHTYSGVTPESSQSVAQSAVIAVLSDVLPILPEISLRQLQALPFRPYSPVPTVQSSVSSSLPKDIVQEESSIKPLSNRSKRLFQSTPSFASPPPVLTDEMDIPMPTPVSVLLQTSDEFISPYNVQSLEISKEDNVQYQQLSSEVCRGAPVNATSYPEETTTNFRSNSTRVHQSAPQLYIGSNNNCDYPSILPSPMTMIPVPEESLLNNTLPTDEFGLEELPLPADDWAIGEGFGFH